MSRRMKVTMRDVARLAGVSVATVSSVINASAVVSPKRTQKVRDAMAALDYHPDQVARSLKVGRTEVIGMMIPDITNSFYPEVIRGVEDAAREAGYSVMLCNTNEDPEQEQRHLSTLLSRRVDGILIACSAKSTAYDRLTRNRTPIVFFDRIPLGLHCSAVGTDNIDAGYQAALRLIELGHQRIAMITGDLTLSPHRDRLEGFRRAMQEHHLAIRKEYLRGGDFQIASGHRAGQELLSLDQPPTAIVSSNNKMLLGLMRALGELGVPCPGRVSVIGFDDYAWTEHFTPRLTIIAQRTYEMGRRAMEMLLGRIQGEPLLGEPVLLKAELRARESTARVALEQVRASG